MDHHKFGISLFFIAVCTVIQASAKGSDLEWLERCRDNEQCPYGIGVYYNNSLICDGVVISKHHVLTAASCFNHVESLDEHLLSVRVDAVDDNTGRFYNIVDTKIHESYKQDDKIDVNYDLALLKIGDKEGFDYSISIALLPYEKLKHKEFKGEMFGWAHLGWREGWDYLTHHPVTVYADPEKCHSFRKDVGSNQFCGILQDKTGDYVHYSIHGSPVIYKKMVIGISSGRAVDIGAQLFLNLYNHVTWISRAMY